MQAAAEPTRLNVLRGNSGSGKSSVAAEIRARYGAHFYYLDVPFEETMRRHATRPQASEFGPEEMRSWYPERDLLPGRIERLIPQPVHLTPLPA